MSSRLNVVFAGVLIALTSALIVMTDGNVGAALAPAVLVISFYGLASLPLRYTTLVFFGVVLLFHNPSLKPMSGHWEGPLTLLGPLLYENLHKLTGIEALRFNLIEVGLVAILLIIVARTLTRNNLDRQQNMPASGPMKVALAVAFLGIFFAIVWGLARGGDSRQLFWQVRMFFWIPFIAIICMRAFKTDEDFRRLGFLLIGVSVIRVIEGIYFYFVIAKPQGIFPEHIMTHDDTVLFVTVMIMFASYFLETLSLRSILVAFLIGGFVMYGIYLNQRRIAYVSLAISLMAVYLFIRPTVRYWLNRAILISAPILILYIVIGMYSSSVIFSPVNNLMSVADSSDVSNQTRNIENYNLIATLRANPIVGSGFGHEYNEVSVAYDISKAMSNYRYIAHNSLLWLASLTGAIGLYFIWIYLPVGVFLAACAYRRSWTTTQRVAAITAIATVVIYMIQAFGDMGVVTWMPSIILCMGLASAANLATRTGCLEPENNNRENK
ncbi:MAG: hypothetical protein GY847_36500 [Proteobacteria bacterium]|nr:hypothetical protein [Pseudomonadota bacterium]